MAVLATLITQLRTLARDLPTSNRSVKETPKGVNDGANTRFALQNPILVGATSIWWSSGSTYRSQVGITVDDANLGLITISPAPGVGTQNSPFQVDYYYYWFIDSDHTEFLNDAARDLTGVGDPTTVIDGLLSALMQYALGHFYQARATQYMHKYSSSGGQAGQSVSVVADGFRKAAKDAFAQGKTNRDEYYKRLGQREAQSSQTISFGIDPITPGR